MTDYVIKAERTDLETIEDKVLSQAKLPASAAHNYICDMLLELTQIAEASELKELSALLRVTTIAAQTHEGFISA